MGRFLIPGNSNAKKKKKWVVRRSVRLMWKRQLLQETRALRRHCRRRLCNRGPLVVFLDLDRTLIYSTRSGIVDDNGNLMVQDEKEMEQQNDPNTTTTTSTTAATNNSNNNDCTHKEKNKDQDKDHQDQQQHAASSFTVDVPLGNCHFRYHVAKRPGVDAFLQELSQFATVHVFTAAGQCYADPILDSLDPTGTLFQKRYYGGSCVPIYDRKNEFVAMSKNVFALKKPRVQLDRKRTVLVDDNIGSFFGNPSNGLWIPPWENDNDHDAELRYVLHILRYELVPAPNVRPILQSIYNLKQEVRELLH